MILGRIGWGFASIVLMGVSEFTFTWPIFLAGAFFNAIPGIVFQLIFIPFFMVALRKTKLIPLHGNSKLESTLEG